MLLWSECSRGVNSSAWPAGECLLWGLVVRCLKLMVRYLVGMPTSSNTSSSLCLASNRSPFSISFFPLGRKTPWWGCQRLSQWGRLCRTEPCQCVIGKAAHCVSHLLVLWAYLCTEWCKGEGRTLTLLSVQQTWLESSFLAEFLMVLKEFFDQYSQGYQHIREHQHGTLTFIHA